MSTHRMVLYGMLLMMADLIKLKKEYKVVQMSMRDMRFVNIIIIILV